MFSATAEYYDLLYAHIKDAAETATIATLLGKLMISVSSRRRSCLRNSTAPG